MCGIAGIVSPDMRALDDRVREMLAPMRHRGPDDSGTYADHNVGLGQNRLAIIDLSDAAHQPMVIDNGRLVVVFNGEIFNYRELRLQLEVAGHVFFSESDTEVLVRAYDEWGERCVERFNGMWGFAIYDRERSIVFCSRDRLGVKPFYYAIRGREFFFASEIKALLTEVPAVPDHHSLVRFLRTSLVDDTTATCFDGISQLLPAHTLTVELSSEGALVREPHRWWSFDPERSRETYDYSDPSSELRRLLEDSVRLRLRADVPVGTCLSGGLDSSSIVAIASGLLDSPVWTFSSIYEVPGYDEGRFARMVNAAFGTNAHEVHPEPGDLLDVLPRIAWHQDLPSAGPGVFSQWHVMEQASSGVTVLLDGQGADELLGGYTPYFIDYLRSRAVAARRRPTPANLARLALDAVSVATRRVGLKSVRNALRTKHLQNHPELLPQYLDAHDSPEAHVPRPGRLLGDPLGDRLLRDTLSVSLPSLLRYEDRNSMAFSIEARTPFLDYRIVEFCLALPFDQRIRGDWTKYALRRAMEPTLPSEITWRRDKLGYPTPLAEWLRGPFRADALEVISSERFRSRGIFDPRAVDAMWQSHQSGRNDYSWNIWRWLSLEFWFRTFIDG